MSPGVTIPLRDGAYVRPLVVADVTASYVDGLNDPDVYEFLVGPRQERQSFERVAEFVRANVADPRAVLFGLFVGGVLRGTSRLHDINNPPGTANLGIALFDKTIWGQGWGSLMVSAISGYAGSAFGVEEVRAGIEEQNIGSQKCFEKAGYQAGNVLREDAGGRPSRTWILNVGNRNWRMNHGV